MKKIYLYLGELDEQLGRDGSTWLKTKFEDRIIPIDTSFKEKARILPLNDFESAIELACAIETGFDAIVSQTPINFASATLPVLSVNYLYNLQCELEKSLEEEMLYQHKVAEHLRQELERIWVKQNNIDRLEYRKSTTDQGTLKSFTLKQRIVAGLKVAGTTAIEELLFSSPTSAAVLGVVRGFYEFSTEGAV